MTYDETLAIYRKLVEDDFGLTLKGKANPYTSTNGNMFSFLDKSGVLCLRLSKEAQEAFRAAYGGEPVVQYGSVMKDYVAVPGAMLDDPETLKREFAKCQ